MAVVSTNVSEFVYMLLTLSCSVVVLKESPYPQGSSRTNLQVLEHES